MFLMVRHSTDHFSLHKFYNAILSFFSLAHLDQTVFRHRWESQSIIVICYYSGLSIYNVFLSNSKFFFTLSAFDG